MGVFEMVSLIVFVSVLGGVINNYLKVKSKQSVEASEDLFEQQEKRLKQVEQRLAVLERIVTSDGYSLKKEFDNLD